jgi:hypothetical protein
MNDVHFYVVTEDTFDEFKERFIKENGDFLFYALSVRDYETIALNMSELKRFIDQQKQIIIYNGRGKLMIKCYNCGHEAHCGVTLRKDFRREPYNHGIEGQIEVCKYCRCAQCDSTLK